MMEDGASAEIAVVGNEGLVGISLFMGAKPEESHAPEASALPTAARPSCSPESHHTGI